MDRRVALAAAAGSMLSLCRTAAAQNRRLFPPETLRGEMVVTAPPAVRLNGKAAQLAPGARIRGQDNLLQMSATLIGAPLQIHYTIDTYGLLRDIWILRPDELQVRPWPRSAADAAAWRFDPIAQTWSRP